jgi:hypothetical protein
VLNLLSSLLNNREAMCCNLRRNDFFSGRENFCISMEVNKTMYGYNEDVPKTFFDNLYPASHLCDVTFAVVWNVLVADEKSVNRPSMN